ncbi:integrase, catalytic region [Pandoraea cepalis]|uniref:Integrase, catalytic region n=1 Tax=Pandoraea cepalis TaxID=2508294 RepID=A0A5E4WZR6_9BURK|nr:integrase, catalytic region [Pandoraea cepalis]
MTKSTFTDSRIMDALKRSESGVAAPVNAVWSMDFMHDLLKDGRSIRLFNVIDDFNRRALGIEIDFSLPSARVIRAVAQIIGWRGKPMAIRCDNDPEYLSETITQWAGQRGIALNYSWRRNAETAAHGRGIVSTSDSR